MKDRSGKHFAIKVRGNEHKLSHYEFLSQIAHEYSVHNKVKIEDPMFLALMEVSMDSRNAK